MLDEVGPALGVPTLRHSFPHVPRCVLSDLLCDYRRTFRQEHRFSLEALTWKRAGHVWAVDHTQPPRPIDGRYPYVLSVRDLASGYQLAWTAVDSAEAEPAATLIESLLAEYGRPLVIKSDNGSAFIARRFAELLDEHQVAHLLSPPRTPRYNGACEAGIGACQARTRYQAARHGRPLDWTSDDLETARCLANEYHYPWGAAGGTPAQRFAGRLDVTPDERADLSARNSLYECQSLELEAARGRVITPLLRAIHRRRALRRALVECGELLITRRSIPQPIHLLRRARIL